MLAVVLLDPRAESNELGRAIFHRVERNLRDPATERMFKRMWGTVVVVCKPQATFEGAAVPRATLTLRFDYGRLVIHEGRVGRPDVTLWGREEEILRAPRTNESFAQRSLFYARNLLGSSPSGLKVFGKVTRPRFVLRLLRLLDV